VRDPAERRRALDLIADGVLPAHAARQLGIPQSTVAHWVDPIRAATYERQRAKAWRIEQCCVCSPSTAPALPRLAYALLLGHYLGDGHITPQRKETWALSVFCSDTWPGVMDEVEWAMHEVLGRKPARVQRAGCTEVKALNPHLLCLFPQHGPGRKHDRRIVLERWQQEIAQTIPGQLLRGLFHSDGWRGENVAVKHKGDEIVRYRYSRYQFSNRSDDIRQICTDALDVLGIAWRRTNRYDIAVSRREAVAALDQHVGPKY
jgi:hypothetical protein